MVLDVDHSYLTVRRRELKKKRAHARRGTTQQLASGTGHKDSVARDRATLWVYLTCTSAAGNCIGAVVNCIDCVDVRLRLSAPAPNLMSRERD